MSREGTAASTASAGVDLNTTLPEPVPIEHAYLLIVRLTDDIMHDIRTKRAVEERHLHQSAQSHRTLHSSAACLAPVCHGCTSAQCPLCLLVPVLRLYSLYGPTLEKALSIVDVDAGNVTLVRGELSGRFLFQVMGSDVRPYTCTLHHCSCPAYTNSVVLSNDSIYVNHSKTTTTTTTTPNCCTLSPSYLTSHLCSALWLLYCGCQCKHQLAARVCHALGRVRGRVVSEVEFNRLMTEDRYRDASAQHGGHEMAQRTWISRA